MLSIGDTITFGLYSDDEGVPVPIEWRVFIIHENQARIIVNNNQLFRHTYTTSEPWRDSQLRAWLNSEIYESIFSAEEKGCIIDTITKDDERYMIMCDDVSDGYIEDRKPIAVNPIVTRDKLTIPQMRDISEIGYKNFDGHMLVEYRVKKDNKDVICSLWKKREEITVLDLFQCRQTNWGDYSTSKYTDLGLFHGRVNWTLNYDSDPNWPPFDKSDMFGYRAWSEKPGINPMAWISVSKYEALRHS